MPASETTIKTTDGRNVRFGECGDADGLPVVYMHASMGSCRVPELWDREARAAGVRLITPERAGFGRSDAQPGRRLLDTARDNGAVCDDLGIDRFAVCGLSGGGPFVLATAYALPERVLAAACMAGIAPFDRDGGFDDLRDSELAVYEVATRSPTASLEIARTMEKQVRESPEQWRQSYRAPQSLDPADQEELATYILETVVLDSCHQGPEAIAYEWWLYCQPWDFALADVRVPVDLWHSMDDEMLPLHHTEYLRSHLPTARLRTWEEGGHLAGAARLGEVLRALVSTAGPATSA